MSFQELGGQKEGTSWSAIVFSLSLAYLGWGVGLDLFRNKLFIYFMLMLYTDFQCSTIPGTGQKVCGGCGWWVGV